jgi:uncharacterized membrane protein HdeD (DUF308 family)
MRALLAKYWWVLLVRGIAAIVFGLMAFTWPALTLATLVLFFGAWALVSGVLLLIGAFGGRAQGSDWWFMLLQGGLGVAVGLVTFANPAMTEIGLLLYIAAWSIATGAVEVVTAIRLREEIEGEGWLILNGALSIAFGFILMLFPAAGALALIWLIASFAVIAGTLMVILGFRLRALGPGTSA